MPARAQNSVIKAHAAFARHRRQQRHDPSPSRGQERAREREARGMRRLATRLPIEHGGGAGLGRKRIGNSGAVLGISVGEFRLAAFAHALGTLAAYVATEWKRLGRSPFL